MLKEICTVSFSPVIQSDPTGFPGLCFDICLYISYCPAQILLSCPARISGRLLYKARRYFLQSSFCETHNG